MNIAPLVLIAWPKGQDLSERLRSFAANLDAASHLARLVDTEGLSAHGDPDGPRFLLSAQPGLIWGTVFDRMTSGRINGARDLRWETESAERYVERQWGDYLVIRRLGGAVEVFRDPSGGMPCYHSRIDGADIFTTRPELLFDAGLMKPEIDWTILIQHMVYRSLRVPRTALRGMSELMPGTAVTIADGEIRHRTIWSPWRFTEPSAEIASVDEAVERVRRAATSCIGAWARCFERPILEISGGLDSSVVGAALARAGATPRCITFANVEGDPDETPYARAATDYLGFELEVLEADVGDVDVTRSHACDLPRPSARAFAQAHEAKLRQVAARTHADAFFSGGGGDNVFAYLKSVLPVIDRWKRGGTGAFATMADMASVADVSIWEVAAQSIARAVRMRAAKRWIVDERFLSPPATGDLPFPHGHPWIQAPARTLPGKLVHARAMMVIQSHLDGLERLHDAPIISPLVSQPLVETCLAIPTWLWCDGGMNRSIARRAFADALPPVVIDRRSKGAFDTYSAQVFMANRGAIREMLLGGALARQGLLDTATIEAKLAGTTPRLDILRMLDLVDVEAWVAAWETRPTAARVP